MNCVSLAQQFSALATARWIYVCPSDLLRSPRAFYRHGNTTALPYAAAFHFLLQLQTLEFERAHLCDIYRTFQPNSLQSFCRIY